MNIQEWFKIGMKRDIPQLLEREGVLLTVGGKEVTDDFLYRPFWNALTQPLPSEDESVDLIFTNHFLEHLPGNRAIFMLKEFERVLKPGGVANIVVPYYTSQMQAHDLDHKSFWTERTLPNIFDNPYYDDFDSGKWKIKVHTCFIMGIVERNMALFIQLVKS